MCDPQRHQPRRQGRIPYRELSRRQRAGRTEQNKLQDEEPNYSDVNPRDPTPL